MPKQITFSKSLPLPPMVREEVAVAMLHDHGEMIGLNPLVIAHRQINAPRGATARETSGYIWHELSEDTSDLSEGLGRSVVTYKACYRNLMNGVEIHIYGPQGLDVKEQWTISQPPEEVSKSSSGIWLRRNCNVTSSTTLAPTTEKNLYRAHQLFEERALEKCLPQRHPSRPRYPYARTSSLRFSRLSSRSSMYSEYDETEYKRSSIGSLLDPSDTHPAFRNDIDWSLVSDEDSNCSPPRTSSLTSRSSCRINTLKRRPNMYNRNERSSEGSSARSSYAESIQLSSPPERCGSSSTYYSTTTSIPGSSIPEETDDEVKDKPSPAAYTAISGNPFSMDSPKASSFWSSSSSTPSLVEESSDEEHSPQIDEIQSPIDIDSAEAGRIFEQMQKHFFASLPPPIPRRAEGHTVPAPLSFRPRSSISMNDGGTQYPVDNLPSRTSSMTQSSSRFRPRKSPKWTDPEATAIATDETEKMLSITYGDDFAVYG